MNALSGDLRQRAPIIEAAGFDVTYKRIMDAADEIDRLTLRVAELEKDAQRLDWLGNQTSNDDAWWWELQTSFNPRELIDKAMEQSK